MTAPELIDLVLDDGSFERWDAPPVVVPADAVYAGELARARERSGLDEAVVTGEGRLRGRRVAVLVCEFAFLAGSIGVAAAERLVVAVERATAAGLSLLAVPVSGGTRVQEGAVALLQMVKTAGAIAAHKAAGLPYLVHLRNPTTGGVLASWGSLGHVTVAEPGALVGFLGPRLYEALYDAPFPAGVQVAENLHQHGLVDAVLPPEDLADVVDRALTVLLSPREGLPEAPDVPEVELPDVPAWESVTRSRRDDRPGVRRLLRHAATDVVPLNGTGEGEADPGLLLALARFGGAPCVLLGQDRRGQTAERPMGPVALREARAGCGWPASGGCRSSPSSTPPAPPCPAPPRRAASPPRSRAASPSSSPSTRRPVSLLLGQGTGGGALALVPADRVVAERPDAADEPEAFCRRVGLVLQQELVRLLGAGPARRYAAPRGPLPPPRAARDRRRTPGPPAPADLRRDRFVPLVDVTGVADSRHLQEER